MTRSRDGAGRGWGRWLVAFALALVVMSVAPLSHAGSYLNRAALLLDQSEKEGDLLQPRAHDKELATIVKKLAEARVDVARAMEVPEAVAKAHPHLLLVLANAEQAAAAAYSGDFKKFVEHLMNARTEAKIFRALLSELGYTLPDL